MARRTEVDASVVAALSVALPRVVGVTTRPGHSLARLTALRVGGPTDLLVHVETPEALGEVAAMLKKVQCPWRAIWPFDPHLPKDGGASGVCITLGHGFEGLSAGPDGSLVLGAATPFAALAAAGAPFSALSRWPGTPGGLLAAGEGHRLAGVVAVITAVSGQSIRRRTVAATAEPPNPSRTTVPISVQLRPVPPAAPAPEPPGRILVPDTSLAEAGGSADEVAYTMVELGLSESRLRGWRLSERWPGVVVQSGAGTSTDLELFARGLAEKLHRERGLRTRLAPRVWGRPSPGPRPRSRP